MDRLLFARLQEEKELVEIEKEKSERLLLNILPASIARQLRSEGQTIANGHKMVTVMFADICGFTEISRNTSPSDLVTLLNGIFVAFDNIVENDGLEKIKTIGDCYRTVGGLPNHRDDHAHAVADAPLEMLKALEYINEKQQPTGHARWRSLRPGRSGCHRQDQVHLQHLGRYGQCREPYGVFRHAGLSRRKPSLIPASTLQSAAWWTAKALDR
jgi:hypothetical protein